MVSIGSLWLPILLSSVAVWLISSVVWMAMPWHKNDYKPLPDEDAARKGLTPQNLAPGQYILPYMGANRSLMKDPGFLKKVEEGPVGFFTVAPRGMPQMGKNLAFWFAYNLAVGLVAAYLASRTLPAGTPYLQVFRVVGTVTWLAYGWAMISEAVWFYRPWSSVAKMLFDALLYAVFTAGFFGWLWPH